MPRGRRRGRRAHSAEKQVPLNQIMPNPVNPMPGPGWDTYLRNMPDPWIWAEEALARASGRTLGRRARTGGRHGHNARQAERIATLLHFGVHYEGPLAELCVMENFSQVKFWIWTNSEGERAEERMIAMLQQATEDWHPYVSHLSQVEDYARRAITIIQGILEDHLRDQVIAGMGARRHSLPTLHPRPSV